MPKKKHPQETGSFYSAEEEIKKAKGTKKPHKRQYQLAFTDQEFLLRQALRPVRLQLEHLRAQLVLQDHDINETIVFFGSARIPSLKPAQRQLTQAQREYKKNPKNRRNQFTLRQAERIVDNAAYLEEATKLAELISNHPHSDYVVATGGGPSFMEAANLGAHRAGQRSVAYNVMLPDEQYPNPYVTPDLTFQFHYFAIRKMHFLLRARALAAFPGGYGTLDEVFEALTLMQTRKIDRIPLLLFNERFWREIINFERLVENGTISPRDLKLFHYVETAEEAWAHICKFYKINP